MGYVQRGYPGSALPPPAMPKQPKRVPSVEDLLELAQEQVKQETAATETTTELLSS